MKNVIKTVALCLAATAIMSSCCGIGDKEDYDKSFAVTTVPTVASVAAVAPEWNQVTLVGSTSTLEDVLERGFMVSTSEAFPEKDRKCYTVSEEEFPEAGEYSVSFPAEGETTYYYKAFTTMKDGKVYYSEVKSVTTPKPLIYSVEGSYTCTEWGYDPDEDDFSPVGSYTVTISFVEGSETEVEIYNLWGGGESVLGVYDPETNTVSVPTGQTIYVHEKYGDVGIYALNEDWSDYDEAVIFQFTPSGGKMISGVWDATCAAGTFSTQYVTMEHDPMEE